MTRILLLLLFWAFTLGAVGLGIQADDGAGPVKAPASRTATVIPVELPLNPQREARLLSTLESLASKGGGLERPLVVLEFKRAGQSIPSAEGEILGRGTSFERALAVARWLTSPKGNRLHTVAFIPESLAGHAVLIALGCEEIALPLDSEFGQGGIDETTVDPTIRQAYVDIADRRGDVFPQAAVVSMVDPGDPLVRIDLVGGATEYVSSSELAKRERKEEEWKEEQLVPNNQLAWFRGQELRSWRWIAYTAGDREQLASALRLSKPLVDEPIFEGPRVAIRIHLSGKVTPRHVDRMLRAIEQGLSNPEVNLLLVELDTPGGNLVESFRLAQYLADIPSSQAEVACYVRNAARGDAALIALAGDTIYMHPKSVLGGPGEASISPQQCQVHSQAFEALASSSGRSLGTLLGVVSSEIPIYEYSSFDGRVQLNSPDWIRDDPVVAQWNQGNEVSFRDGLKLETAESLNLVAGSATSIDEVASKFGIDSLPPELKTNVAEQMVDWLASQVWLSFLLFAIGITALSAELSSPGIGFPAILAAICFGLFFWLRFLDGTVEWLEVLLIAGGVSCLLVEIFLLPGFGVFGVSGLAMLGLGLLLAGQTFIWPTNDYQRGKMVQGFGQIGLIVLSLIGVAILFRKQIMNSPMVKWIALEAPPPSEERLQQELLDEELRAFIGWNGRTLTRCNPHGRATIGDKIWNVISEEGWIDEDSEIIVVGIQDQKLLVRMRAT